LSASGLIAQRPNIERRRPWREAATAASVFRTLCLVVLARSPQLLEPDDYAYRASIVALSSGHLLLTNAQYLASKAQLSVHGGLGVEQWVRLRSGKWISQKNPGYPFLKWTPISWTT
jgi:hypothetical protein